MNRQERLMKVVLAPHISEKTTTAAEKQRTFVFKVVKDAEKQEIKDAVELMFNVKVDDVRVTTVKGKAKGARMGAKGGRRQDWKKAYVALQSGYNIDFMGGQ
ncbi:MAG: 50S ribosomal protein L23 [Gammaproteobacteria bacterium]|nr:50S ribosomal protein L23 [Gammaproteobacteria bacterium]